MQAQKIVILRTDLIGDFIIWLDAAQYIRMYYPKARITLICNNVVADLARMLNIFDEVITLEPAKLRKYNITYLMPLIYKIRKIKYDTLICPMVTRSPISDLLVLIIKASQKIGANADYTKFDFLKKLFDLSFSTLVRLQNLNRHELKLNIEFINSIFGMQKSAQVPALVNLLKYPLEATNLNATNYLVINLSSSVSYKNWPLQNFIDLVKVIPQDITIVILGAKHELAESNIFENSIDTHKVINLVNKTTIPQAISIISNSRLLIGNDSALVHLATALNKPSLSFLGGGFGFRYLPYEPEITNLTTVIFKQLPCYNCRWHCQYELVKNKTWQCIANISLEDAIPALKKSISNNCSKNII